MNPWETASLALALSEPAPDGGVTVTLTSSDPSKVTVAPPSVVIPQGATTPSTQPQVIGVSIGSATITAVAIGYKFGAGTVNVSAPTMTFTGSPMVIAIGGAGNLTLNLAGGRAPVGGLTVSLNSTATTQAKVPAKVLFAAGETSVIVPVTGLAAGTATITAAAPNMASASAKVTVTLPPTVIASYDANSLQAINVALTNTSGVTAVNLRITNITNVTALAPNVIVFDQSLVGVPNFVFPMGYGNVDGGKGGVRTFGFKAAAGSVEVPFSFTITYQADNMPPQSAVIDVPFPRSMSFAGNSLAIKAGTVGTLVLNLSGTKAPAGGLPVNLSSGDPSSAIVQPTMAFAAGATTLTVPVTGIAPGLTVITANATVVGFAAKANATVTVSGAPAISTPAKIAVVLGQSAPFPVMVSGPAPDGGLTVTLSSSDATKASVPPSVLIAAGATTPVTQPQVAGTGIGSAAITASAPSFTSGSGMATVSAPIIAFSVSPLVIGVGGSGNLTLNLTGGRAPIGGLTVSLTSSDPSKGSVPKTLSLPAGATGVPVPVMGVALGSVTITASSPSIANATATVNVIPPTVTISYFGPNNSLLTQTNVVLANTSIVVAVNLRITNITVVSAPPPNVIVFDRTVAGNPNFPILGLNLAGGASIGPLSFGFRATAGSLSAPFSFMVAYQADNVAPQTALINVPFPRLLTFSGSPLSINAGSSGKLVLDLDGPAPVGGLIVQFSSSDPGKATVPSTVSIASGVASVNVPVTSVAGGSVGISASAPGFNAVTITVTVGGKP